MKNLISRLKKLFTYVEIIPKGCIWHVIPLGCNIHMDELNCSNLQADVLAQPKCNTDEYLYAFKYNPDIFDSCSETMSIHKTYKGAYKNLRRFLLDKHEQWLELPKKYRELYCIEYSERYFIRKIKLND